MATAFPFFLSCIPFLLSVFFLFKTMASKKNSSSNLPPGPWKLPLVGNIHQLLAPLPHHSITNLALKFGPLMHLQLGQVSTIVVSSSDVALQVLKTLGIQFADRPHSIVPDIIFYGCTDIAFSPYGDYWRQMRRICQLHILSSKRIQSFRSIRESEVHGFISIISESLFTQINLTKLLFSLNYGITAMVAFGKKSEAQEAYISAVKTTFRYLGGFNVADMYPSFQLLHLISGVKAKVKKLHQELDSILRKILMEHKQKKVSHEEEEDLVDALLKIEEHEYDLQLSDDNIKAVINDIFSAGSESSAITMEWAMSEMLKNPSVMRRAQEEVRRVFKGKENADDETKFHELEYLKCVIKETLRLHPAGPLSIPRECREECEILGYQIPSKTRLMVNIWAIGRDPKYWTDAEKFMPDRFLDTCIDFKGTNFNFIPFGAGRRICPGITFAMASIELVLAQLLFHFDWTLPGGAKHEELDMTEEFGLSVKRKRDLHLIPTPHDC